MRIKESKTNLSIMYEEISQDQLVYEVVQSRRFNRHIWNDGLMRNKESHLIERQLF